MIYFAADTKATPASIFKLIWISHLHNVVKRLPSFLSNWNQWLFPLGVKGPVREADSSSPSSTDVKGEVEL
jgi:hypothetical protein